MVAALEVFRQGYGLGEAAKTILDMDDDDAHVERVVGLRQYAAVAA